MAVFAWLCFSDGNEEIHSIHRFRILNDANCRSSVLMSDTIFQVFVWIMQQEDDKRR